MNIITFPTGVYAVNTYLIENENTKECIIVDPGGSFDLIEQMVDKCRVIPQHVLLTHAHFDHIGALEAVRARYKTDVYCHAECSRAIFDPMLNLSAYTAMTTGTQIKCEPAEHLLEDGQEIELIGFKIKALHSPGHSKGSIVYIMEKCAFTGDVLFKLSIGRSDLFGGDEEILYKSLSRLKKVITPDMKILPGHGEESHASYEFENNHYIMRL